MAPGGQQQQHAVGQSGPRGASTPAQQTLGASPFSSTSSSTSSVASGTTTGGTGVVERATGAAASSGKQVSPSAVQGNEHLCVTTLSGKPPEQSSLLAPQYRQAAAGSTLLQDGVGQADNAVKPMGSAAPANIQSASSGSAASSVVSSAASSGVVKAHDSSSTGSVLPGGLRRRSPLGPDPSSSSSGSPPLLPSSSALAMPTSRGKMQRQRSAPDVEPKKLHSGASTFSATSIIGGDSPSSPTTSGASSAGLPRLPGGTSGVDGNNSRGSSTFFSGTARSSGALQAPNTAPQFSAGPQHLQPHGAPQCPPAPSSQHDAGGQKAPPSTPEAEDGLLEDDENDCLSTAQVLVVNNKKTVEQHIEPSSSRPASGTSALGGTNNNQGRFNIASLGSSAIVATSTSETSTAPHGQQHPEEAARHDTVQYTSTPQHAAEDDDDEIPTATVLQSNGTGSDPAGQIPLTYSSHSVSSISSSASSSQTELLSLTSPEMPVSAQPFSMSDIPDAEVIVGEPLIPLREQGHVVAKEKEEDARDAFSSVVVQSSFRGSSSAENIATPGSGTAAANASTASQHSTLAAAPADNAASPISAPTSPTNAATGRELATPRGRAPQVSIYHARSVPSSRPNSPEAPSSAASSPTPRGTGSEYIQGDGGASFGQAQSCTQTQSQHPADQQEGQKPQVQLVQQPPTTASPTPSPSVGGVGFGVVRNRTGSIGGGSSGSGHTKRQHVMHPNSSSGSGRRSSAKSMHRFAPPSSRPASPEQLIIPTRGGAPVPAGAFSRNSSPLGALNSASGSAEAEDAHQEVVNMHMENTLLVTPRPVPAARSPDVPPAPASTPRSSPLQHERTPLQHEEQMVPPSPSPSPSPTALLSEPLSPGLFTAAFHSSKSSSTRQSRTARSGHKRTSTSVGASTFSTSSGLAATSSASSSSSPLLSSSGIPPLPPTPYTGGSASGLLFPEVPGVQLSEGRDGGVFRFGATDDNVDVPPFSDQDANSLKNAQALSYVLDLFSSGQQQDQVGPEFSSFAPDAPPGGFFPLPDQMETLDSDADDEVAFGKATALVPRGQRVQRVPRQRTNRLQVVPRRQQQATNQQQVAQQQQPHRSHVLVQSPPLGPSLSPPALALQRTPGFQPTPPPAPFVSEGSSGRTPDMQQVHVGGRGTRSSASTTTAACLSGGMTSRGSSRGTGNSAPSSSTTPSSSTPSMVSTYLDQAKRQQFPEADVGGPASVSTHPGPTAPHDSLSLLSDVETVLASGADAAGKDGDGNTDEEQNEERGAAPRTS
ncbi:unnamed protein product [Amoebophrya sp. A25]|nr:unnamed protein product [Amoebophrya sp. A25]|eukprot:GSA25T00006702001.1